MKLLASVLVVATFLPCAAHAQCARTANWWELFEIRKTFDGGSGEGEAANIGLVNASTESTTTWFLDGGVRTKPCQRALGTKTEKHIPATLYWYPSAEWHHLSAEPLLKQNKTDQAGAAIKAELWFGYDAASTAPRWYFISKGSVTRDFLNDKTITSADLLLSVYQERGLHPSHGMSTTNRYWGSYFPYVGFQYLRRLAITQNDTIIAPTYDGGAGLARVQFELYPLFNKNTIPGAIPFVVSGEYAYRRLVKEAETIDTRHMNFFDVAFTWFPDPGHSIGVGLTITRGRAPSTNFISQQRVMLGVKIKR
jgi:hypothetical protein